MTRNQAFNKLLTKRGKWFKVTGPDSGQCTAVPHLLQKILGLPIVYGNAADIFRNASSAHYKKLGRTAKIQRCDIIVWGKNAAIRTTRFGHVAVGDKDLGRGYFRSLDQNWPTGARTQYIIHPRTGVIGILRPKKFTVAGKIVPKLTRVNRIFRKYRGRNVTKSEFRIFKKITDSRIIKRLRRR